MLCVFVCSVAPKRILLDKEILVDWLIGIKSQLYMTPMVIPSFMSGYLNRILCMPATFLLECDLGDGHLGLKV